MSVSMQAPALVEIKTTCCYCGVGCGVLAQTDGEEILTLRWFTRAELTASLDEIVLPGKVSIARAVIEEWLGESLDQDDAWNGRPA